jgi:hypothetical protein
MADTQLASNLRRNDALLEQLDGTHPTLFPRLEVRRGCMPRLLDPAPRCLSPARERGPRATLPCFTATMPWRGRGQVLSKISRYLSYA